VGWAVFPTAGEAAVFKNLNINYISCVPAYNQLGAVAALRSPESAPAVAAMVAAFQERRDLMVERLSAVPGVTCGVPKGAFYVFPNIAGVCERIGAIGAWEALPPQLRSLSSPSTLFMLFLLYRHGVATLDRRAFGKIGAEGQHYLRLSVATGMAELRAAAERIARAAEDGEGFAEFVAEGRRLH
jgi:aspartate/methionine/tyrosine aminotransferase